MSRPTQKSPGVESGEVRAPVGRDRGELRRDASVLASCVEGAPSHGENRHASVRRFFTQEEEDGWHLLIPSGERLEGLKPDVPSVFRV